LATLNTRLQFSQRKRCGVVYIGLSGRTLLELYRIDAMAFERERRICAQSFRDRESGGPQVTITVAARAMAVTTRDSHDGWISSSICLSWRGCQLVAQCCILRS